MLLDVGGALGARLQEPQPGCGPLQRRPQLPAVGDADELRAAEAGGTLQIQAVRSREQLLEAVRGPRDG